MTSLTSLNNHIYNCTKCSDCVKVRMYSMPGFYGKSDIRLAIIGQNPGLPQSGEEERLRRLIQLDDKLYDNYETHYSIGLKNCSVGKFVDKVCETLNIGWRNIFFSNIIKCATPQCRVPSDIEVNNCIGYLHQQLDILKPKTILFLGHFPVAKLDHSLRAFHYYMQDGVKLISVYHPSFIKKAAYPGLEEKTLKFIKKTYNL